MKRIFALLLVITILLSFTACSKDCQEIILKDDKITLTEPGDTYKLKVSTDPKDTDDKLKFESEDEDIATVDKNGKVTAIAPGKTVIVITCGDETAECKVICDFDEDAPAEDSDEPAVCGLCGGDGICDYCNGSAICPDCYGLKQCITCAGIGKIGCTACGSNSSSCYRCDGKGYLLCSDCDATGRCATCEGNGKLCDKCDLGFCPDCYEG